MWRVMGIPKNMGESYSAGELGDSFPTKTEAEAEVERRKAQNPDFYWSIREDY